MILISIKLSTKSEMMYQYDTFSIPDIFRSIWFSIKISINIFIIFLKLLPPSVKIHKLFPLIIFLFVVNPIDNTIRSELRSLLGGT